MRKGGWIRYAGTALLLTALPFAGCARLSIVQPASPAAAASAAAASEAEPAPMIHQATVHTWFWGFWTKSPLQDQDLALICPQGWSRLATYAKPLQVVAKVLTLNFYSPWTAEVECLQKR